MRISTRLHGIIDYAVSLALAGAASSRALPPPVRKVLGTASAFHTSYSVVTDYEGGAHPGVSMQQHLLLDALGGAAICAAGLMMRDQPPKMRAALIGIGLAELAVVAASSAHPRSGPGQGFGPVGRLLDPEARWAENTSYPPLDTPKPVDEGVFIVDSQLPGTVGMVIGARMTVLRLPDGGLLLHSPTRFSHALKRQLEQIGPIRHFVAPNIAHWTFLRDWQAACPEATTWAAPGLRQRRQVRQAGLRLDHDLTGTAPADWGGTIDLVVVPGGLGFHETALFHQPSRSLLLTDIVMNLEEPKVPPLLRPLLRLFGMTAPDGMPPPYLRAVVRMRQQDALRAAEHLLALQPERVIFAHGRWFERDGTPALRRSLRWLLRG
ncbi:DUF4336 domain-containing protein [Roseomonas sp. ACRSG]|nr:DUF4336 domain-containing protein [Roseomonas sp. ACRSG]